MHDIVLNGINLEDILYKENTLLYDVFLCNEIKKTNLKCTFIMTSDISKPEVCQVTWCRSFIWCFLNC